MKRVARSGGGERERFRVVSRAASLGVGAPEMLLLVSAGGGGAGLFRP